MRITSDDHISSKVWLAIPSQVLHQCKISRGFRKESSPRSALPATFGGDWEARMISMRPFRCIQGAADPFQSHCKMKYGPLCRILIPVKLREEAMRWLRLTT